MTRAPSSRINARLPAEVARKAAYLERRTGKSTTQVIIESLERYYETIRSEEVASEELFADFVGCSAGPSDLSTSYKAELSRSLGAKGK